jgi:hypothetical protein
LNLFGDAKLTRSMSRKGCSPDDAACEGFFGRLKTELFYPRQWRATTIEQFIQILDSYIRWYNEKRIKVSLGSLSPLEYRVSLGTGATIAWGGPIHRVTGHFIHRRHGSDDRRKVAVHGPRKSWRH